MTVRTSAGTTLKVSASSPATFDPTGYNALTMTVVGEVSDLGEFGREFNLVTFNPVGSRGVVKKKGSFNQGTMTIQLGLDTDDAGQILLKSASLSDSDHSFLVTTQNGDKYYFQAQVMSFKVNIGSVDLNFAEDATLTLTEADLVGLSDSTNTLTIHGGVDDTVTMIGAQSVGTSVIDGQTYDIYSLGDDGTVIINEDINECLWAILE